MDLGAARDACVAGLNQYRAMMGLKALVRWTAEESCADNQANLDATAYATKGLRSASNPNGWDHDNFMMCTETNQCACWVGGDPASMGAACAQMWWNEGPSGFHYRAMMDPSNTVVACGFSNNGPYGWWNDQDFN